MARVLASVSGVALRPGVSKNKRYYSREAVADAVRKAQAQLAEGSMPLTTRTHHSAEDDSTRIVGRVRSLTLAEDGSARFTADIADTEHGRTIASLLDTSDGEPFLSGVSIRGAWNGTVRKMKSETGETCEAGDSLTLHGLDYTAAPGVPGAAVDTFAWAAGGTTETVERVLITESVQEARLTITEEAAPADPSAPEGVREALQAVFGEAATVPMSKRDSGLKGGKGTPYADPGYQPDGVQRYELDSPAHIRAAYAFISQAKNAKPYSAQQLKRIKGRIKAAAVKAGVTITAEGWCVSPAMEVTEALVEFYGGDPECAGSYSLSATNGPTTVTVCSYGLDPADLQVILAQACKGAGLALMSLDPDMDADIDVEGAPAEDTDGDADSLAARLAAAIRGESDESPEDVLAEHRQGDEAVTETATEEDPAPEPAAADRTGSEAPVTESTPTTETAATAPASLTQADVTAAVAQALAAEKAARKARKAGKGPAAESAPAAPVTETAATQAPDGDAIARMVREGIAAALATEGLTETAGQKVERLVREGVTAAKQELAAQGGGPARKGLVTEHSGSGSGEIPADFPMKNGAMIPMDEWTTEQRRAAGAQLEAYILGSRASQ